MARHNARILNYFVLTLLCLGLLAGLGAVQAQDLVLSIAWR